jgi:hypothetical protein
MQNYSKHFTLKPMLNIILGVNNINFIVWLWSSPPHFPESLDTFNTLVDSVVDLCLCRESTKTKPASEARGEGGRGRGVRGE